MTTLSIETQQDDLFKKGILASLFLHGIILTLFFFRFALFSQSNLMYESAVRVDLVALPDKLKPEEKLQMQNEKPNPPKPLEKPIEKQQTKPSVDAINLNKSKSKQSAAFAKLKELQALEKIRKNVEREEREERAKKVFKGNQISSGSELTGIAKIQHDNYIANVKKHIYRNWALPEWLAEKNYKSQILVKFDRAGNVIAKRLVRSSGNPSYDEATLEAIDKSSPAPPPPDNLAGVLANEGVLIGFPE